MLTLTLNAALDVTYRVREVVIGQSHRVEHVDRRAGGKGVNVARVLHALGHDVVVSGLVAGRAGDEIRSDVVDAGMREAFLRAGGESRRTVTIVDALGATVLNEPGDQLSLADWPAFEARFRELMTGMRVVVASGSLPPCVPADAYARLTHAGHAAGCRVIVDTAGAPLLAAAEAGADLLKPNAAELLEATGAQSVEDGADALLERGAGAVAASLGSAGMLIRTRDRTVMARPRRVVSGNPTGAGDAAVAALALALNSDWDLEDAVRYAVSLSAAAVAHPLAGSFVDSVLDERLGSPAGPHIPAADEGGVGG